MTNSRRISRCSVLMVSGMTLLETLAALAILSMVAVGGGAWVVSTSQAGRAVTASSQDAISLARAFNAIRADLIEAMPTSIEFDTERNEVRMITARRAPSANEGWRRVTWKLVEDTLARSERILPSEGRVDDHRAVLYGVEAFTFTIDQEHESDSSSEVVFITLRLNSGAHGQRIWALDP